MLQRLVLFLLFTVCTLVLPVRAELPLADLERRVQESITPKIPLTPSNQQREIIQALQKAMFSVDNMSILWWNQFLAANRNEVARVEARLGSLQPARYAKWKILKNSPMSKGYKRPDYGKYAKQVPYIYVTDASAHGTQSIVNEVEQMLRSVRRANPQKSILLALEFAEMNEPEPPIRFAKQENPFMDIADPYDRLVAVADELDIDILALEDFIELQSETWFLYKIGNYFVGFISEAHPDFVQNPKNLTNEEKSKLRGFLFMSTLGMRFRNEQWAGYINAAKPFYDIVIVYAGSGHTDSYLYTWKDVPELVGEKYIAFNFIAAEEAPKRQQAYEDTTSKLLTNNHSWCSYPVPALLKREDPEMKSSYCPSIWNVKKQGDDWTWQKKDFLYFKTEKAEKEKYVKSLPADAQRTYRQAQEAIRKAEAEKLELIRFSVFLPEWPKAVQDL